MTRNIEVFYYLIDKECNKASVYNRYMYKPSVCYLAMKFGISNKKAHQYLEDFKKELASAED